MPDCPICANKNPDTLEAIRVAYIDEGASAEDLSIEHEIPYELMINHLSRCIKTGDGKSVDDMKDRSEDLRAAYERIREALEIAHNEYLADPKGSNAQGYSQLSMQFRGMLLDLQGLDSPEKIASELANDVVGPLVSRLITTLTEEFRQARENITQKTDPEYAKSIATVFNDSLKRVGAQISKDQQEAVVKIQKRFNLEEDSLPTKHKRKSNTALP